MSERGFDDNGNANGFSTTYLGYQTNNITFAGAANSALQDLAGGNLPDPGKAIFSGLTSALGAGIVNTARSGAVTAIEMSGGQVLENRSTFVGNALFSGATGSAYSNYAQNVFSQNYVQPATQATAFSQLTNAFAPSNSLQLQAIQNVISAFSSKGN